MTDLVLEILILQETVIPVETGIQPKTLERPGWAPTFVGVTVRISI
jgi:hypothetical protein